MPHLQIRSKSLPLRVRALIPYPTGSGPNPLPINHLFMTLNIMEIIINPSSLNISPYFTGTPQIVINDITNELKKLEFPLFMINKNSVTIGNSYTTGWTWFSGCSAVYSTGKCKTCKYLLFDKSTTISFIRYRHISIYYIQYKYVKKAIGKCAKLMLFINGLTDNNSTINILNKDILNNILLHYVGTNLLKYYI